VVRFSVVSRASRHVVRAIGSQASRAQTAAGLHVVRAGEGEFFVIKGGEAALSIQRATSFAFQRTRLLV
jgi:hypothetical protein